MTTTPSLAARATTNIKGEAGDDVIEDSGSNGGTIYGGYGDDLISAAGAGIIHGGFGNDTISGGTPDLRRRRQR